MGFSYSTNDVPEVPELIPSGTRTLIVLSVALKPSKQGGEYINVMFSDVDTGATAFCMFNVNCPSNREVQNRAQRDFGLLFMACGRTGDVNEFTMENIKSHKVTAFVGQKSDSYGIKNTFTKFASVGAVAPQPSKPAAPMGGSDLPF